MNTKWEKQQCRHAFGNAWISGWQIFHLSGLILLPTLYAGFRLAVPPEYPLLTNITNLLKVLGGAWGGMVLVAMVVMNNKEEAGTTLWSNILATYRSLLQKRIFLPILTCFLYVPIVMLAQNLIFYRTISVEVSGAGRAQIYRSPEPRVLESLGTTEGGNPAVIRVPVGANELYAEAADGWGGAAILDIPFLAEVGDEKYVIALSKRNEQKLHR